MVEKAIYARLAADAGILALVSTTAIDFEGDPSSKHGVRIYPVDGAAAPLYPAIRYRRTDRDGVDHLQGASGLVQASIQIECWSQVDYYSTAKTLADLVRLSLNGRKWTAAGYTDVVTVLDGEQDKLQKSPGAPPGTVWPSVVQQYNAWYTEAIS